MTRGGLGFQVSGGGVGGRGWEYAVFEKVVLVVVLLLVGGVGWKEEGREGGQGVRGWEGPR